MSKRLNRISLISVPIFAIMACIALAMLAGGSAGGVLASGRSVMTYSDSISLSSSFSADTATIYTAGKEIIVRPTTLIVDGVTLASIEENVADVQVHVKRGLVTFVADGKPVQTQ